ATVGLVIITTSMFIRGSYTNSDLQKRAAFALGILCVICGFLSSLLMSRNPWIQKLTGRSYEQNGSYHMIAGVCCGICGIGHSVFQLILSSTLTENIKNMNTSGVILFIA